jgi:Tol biopolymer transport system component
MPLLAASTQGTLLEVFGRASPTRFEVVRGQDALEAASALAKMREAVPDGNARRLAGIISDGGLRGDLWVGEPARGTLTRVTHAYPAASPVWSRDGRSLVFSAAADGPFNLWRADPEAPVATRLLSSRSHQFASDVGRAGEIVFTQIDSATRGDIYVRAPDGRVAPLVQTNFDERDGVISPGGEWLAYRSDESGRWQVYLSSIAGGKRSAISEPGAGRAWWLDDGRLAYVNAAGHLAEIRVAPDGSTAAGPLRAFAERAIVSVAASGAVLVSRTSPAFGPPTLTMEAWQEIWHSLPPAVGNLPR